MKIKLAILALAIIGLVSIFFLKKETDQNKNQIIKSSNKLIVGTSADFAPFSFLENNQIVGFDIDIANEVASRLDMDIEIINRSFDMLIPELQLNKIHMIAAGMSTTEERKKQALFTEPHIEGTKLIAVSKKNKKINNFKELEKEQIIVNTGYKADLFLSEFPKINLKRLPTVTDALLALNSNKGTVFVTAENTIKPYFKDHNIESYNIFTLEEGQEDTALAISKQHPEIHTKISKIIKNMKNDGTIEKLEKKWGIK